MIPAQPRRDRLVNDGQGDWKTSGENSRACYLGGCQDEPANFHFTFSLQKNYIRNARKIASPVNIFVNSIYDYLVFIAHRIPDYQPLYYLSHLTCGSGNF